METNFLEIALEMIPFLELPEGGRILEVCYSSPQIAPVLESAHLLSNRVIDLCLLNGGEMNSAALGYYEQIFFRTLSDLNPKDWQNKYDVVLIPMALNQLNKGEGKELLNQLLRTKVPVIYTLVADDALDQTWTIPDFKTFDISFYRLPKIKQKLIKVYYTISKEISLLPPLVERRETLSILYVLTHQCLTGGLKILYEQMKALQKKGHKIKVMIRGDYENVVPKWVEGFVPDEEIVRLPHQAYLNEKVEADVIFVTFIGEFDQLLNDRMPVFYWEQGHEALYGDIQFPQNEPFARRLLKKQFSQPIYYATNSSYVHDLVQTRFSQNSYLLPICIDTSFYYPKIKDDKSQLTILLVGNPALEFKGFVKALTVLLEVWNQGFRFSVVWACQIKPEVSPVPFEIDYQVNVSQLELANIYQRSDILLSCSDYEGAAMPPLEAMASGVCVVATDCGGIMNYARPEENALISKTHQVSELAQDLIRLLTDQQLREMLIQNGLKTAQSLNLERGIILLENILQTVVDDFKSKGAYTPSYKVSVIIPAYQMENYLLRSVSSVLHQTLNEVEVIIVDDGSTDQTPKLCDDIAKTYPNVRVIHQENQGSARAREVGVHLASGEYLLFLDADDWLDHKALDKLYSQAKQEEADIVMYQAFFVIGNKGYELNMFDGCYEEISSDPLLHFLQDKIKPSLCAKFIRRTFFNDHHIQFPNISYAEDVVVTGQLLAHHPKLSFCDDRLYLYDQREGSLVHSVNETRLEIFKALEEIANILNESQLYDRYAKEYVNFSLYHLAPVAQVCEKNGELWDKFQVVYRRWCENYLGKDLKDKEGRGGMEE